MDNHHFPEEFYREIRPESQRDPLKWITDVCIDTGERLLVDEKEYIKAIIPTYTEMPFYASKEDAFEIVRNQTEVIHAIINNKEPGKGVSVHKKDVDKLGIPQHAVLGTYNKYTDILGIARPAKNFYSAIKFKVLKNEKAVQTKTVNWYNLDQPTVFRVQNNKNKLIKLIERSR